MGILSSSNDDGRPEKMGFFSLASTFLYITGRTYTYKPTIRRSFENLPIIVQYNIISGTPAGVHPWCVLLSSSCVDARPEPGWKGPTYSSSAPLGGGRAEVKIYSAWAKCLPALYENLDEHWKLC